MRIRVNVTGPGAREVDGEQMPDGSVQFEEEFDDFVADTVDEMFSWPHGNHANLLVSSPKTGSVKEVLEDRGEVTIHNEGRQQVLRLTIIRP